MQPVGESRLVHLPLHRIEHVAIAVPDIDGHRSTRPVDVAAAVNVPDVDAFGAVDQRTAQPRQVEQVRWPLFGGRFNLLSSRHQATPSVLPDINPKSSSKLSSNITVEHVLRHLL